MASVLRTLRRQPPAFLLRHATSTPTRLASTTASKEPSHHAQFYKTFGRPIAKTALMAILTYQLVYYLWTRLETDETRRNMNATISELELRIEQLEKAKKP
ncbi:hypothetical protein F5Y15DRAFT_335582 [Xylariaceae sp. FL0016]|nr:hypothetical protein F5Y15DRAFT_335582 [Xylariaceae sp. FL0016]